MTLTKFMARSTWVAYAFELGKLLKCHLKEKPAGNWQMDRILKILKKENGPRASSAPALELNTIIFKHVYCPIIIGICSRSQVSVYRTIGPLVLCCSSYVSETAKAQKTIHSMEMNKTSKQRQKLAQS